MAPLMRRGYPLPLIDVNIKKMIGKVVFSIFKNSPFSPFFLRRLAPDVLKLRL